MNAAGSPGDARAGKRRAATTTLVTGPARSGKSRHAEDLLSGHDGVSYVATGRRADPADPEWVRRVESHQARRPSTWRTVETTDLDGVVGSASGPLLIDCLGTWVTGVVDEVGWDDLDEAARVVVARTASLVESLCAATVPIVVVTNEVGWSLVPTTASGRFFQDELGRLNAAVSAVAERVHLVVAGRVLDLSGSPLVSPSTPVESIQRPAGAPDAAPRAGWSPLDA